MKYLVAVIPTVEEVDRHLSFSTQMQAALIATIEGENFTVIKSRYMKNNFYSYSSQPVAVCALTTHITSILTHQSDDDKRKAALAKLTSEDKKILGLSS